jgi:TatD DNase family protein
MIIDSHAHLYSYDNIDEVVSEAKNNKVDTIITISTDLESCKMNIEISEKYNNVYSAVGIHPCDVINHKFSDLTKLEELAHNRVNVAIGEIGLDFYHSTENKELQYKFFDFQVDIAQRMNLPFVIHARESYSEVIDYLSSKKIKSDFVVHCFTGNKHEAKRLLDLNSFISFTGIITFKKSNELREVAAYIPENRLMIETDSPYLSPHPKRGKTNYPKNLIYIAESICSLKKVNYESFCNTLRENTVKFYRL